MLFSNKIRSLYQLQELLDNDSSEELTNWIKTDPITAIREMTDTNQKDFSDYGVDSLSNLENALQNDVGLRDAIRNNPEAFVRYITKETHQPEFRIYRLLVGSLCALVIMISLGMMIAWIAMNSRTAPPSITAIGCMALGLLAGTFISVPGRSMKSQDGGRQFRNRNRNN